MAKYYGRVGYAVTKETAPGVWRDKIVEKMYAGDLVRPTTSRWQVSQDGTNDNLTINNLISIVADPFAYEYFHSIKYVEFMGSLWKVISVEVQRPRLILTMGGLYNGQA